MKLRPEEITSILKERIEDYNFRSILQKLLAKSPNPFDVGDAGVKHEKFIEDDFTNGTIAMGIHVDEWRACGENLVSWR